MNQKQLSTLDWLLEGDVSIQYQTHRDLLNVSDETIDKLRRRIEKEGWGSLLLEKQDKQTGLWGNGIYSPKWISTHYTLLDLKNLGIHPSCPQYINGANRLLEGIWKDGGKVTKSRRQDLCVSAMALGMFCYGEIQSDKLTEIVDYLLEKQYSDGGWNCNWDSEDCNRNVHVHSSLHTTLTVLEAFRDYEAFGYSYRLANIQQSILPAQEFILKKHLFRSVNTGEIIDHRMTMLSYPSRWKYDILRCMDYFASMNKPYDVRMEEALLYILKKKRQNGRWPLQQKHAGRVHFDMEQTGRDSRWNTLRALRVLQLYETELHEG